MKYDLSKLNIFETLFLNNYIKLFNEKYDDEFNIYTITKEEFNNLYNCCDNDIVLEGVINDLKSLSLYDEKAIKFLINDSHDLKVSCDYLR